MEFAGSRFEIKSLTETGLIEGLLAGFDNVDSYGDRIRPGAFSKTLAERAGRPLPMLLHHDTHRPIGTWREWREDKDGLYVKGALTMATQDAQEAHALARDGALTGLSIGYWVIAKEEDQRSGVTDLLEINLVEGSLVTIPANPKTRVSGVKAIQGPRDIAQLLQEAGISGRRAKAAAGAAWKAINEGEELGDIARLFEEHTARLAEIGG